jgi:hypothetical protein
VMRMLGLLRERACSSKSFQNLTFLSGDKKRAKGPQCPQCPRSSWIIPGAFPLNLHPIYGTFRIYHLQLGMSF